MLRRWFVAGLFVLPRMSAEPGPEESRILTLANARRRERGVRPLAWDEELAQAARLHSERMAALGFFGHDDPERGAIGDRLRGLHRRAVAENLHRSYGHNDPAEAAVNGWMTSDGHRRNLLNGIYSRTGIGVARAKDGSTFATQIFSSR